MDFAIRTISFAISMRIRSPPTAEKARPRHQGRGSWESGGGRERSKTAALPVERKRLCPTSLPSVTPDLRGHGQYRRQQSHIG
jgi:hypothetical protein